MNDERNDAREGGFGGDKAGRRRRNEKEAFCGSHLVGMNKGKRLELPHRNKLARNKVMIDQCAGSTG